MCDTEIKNPLTLRVARPISEATMDSLIPISSYAYMTIPVTKWDKHLTKRYLGCDCMQLVIEAVLFCCRSALLGCVH